MLPIGVCASLPAFCRTWIRSRHSKEPALAQRESHLFTPTWTREALRKRSGIERFAGTRFSLLSSPLCGWSELALTSAASVSVDLAAEPTGLPDLIRSPKRVLAHLWRRIPSYETPSMTLVLSNGVL